MQLATVSTEQAAPVIVAARLRRGAPASARGAVRLVRDGLTTARRAGVTGRVVVRADYRVLPARVRHRLHAGWGLQANAARLVAATIAFNLTRAIGVAVGGKFTARVHGWPRQPDTYQPSARWIEAVPLG